MTLHGKNILGASLSAKGINTFRAVDPARDEAIEPLFHEAREDEINQAVELADLAFGARQPRDPVQIGDLLERIAEEIEALGNGLIERAAAETGLPTDRLEAERARTTSQLRMFARVAVEGSWVDARLDRADPQRKPVAKPDLRRMLAPLGVVAVFGAGNFPLAFSVAGGDTASALAAGNPVVVKAHPAHPGTSELVGGAIQRAVAATAMPEDWFSMLHGSRPQVGFTLVRHRAVRAVGFTGSLAAGKALAEAVAARPEPVPVFAEMGSINPLFLLPGALAERAEAIAAGLHRSLTLGVGQFCTNPGLVVALEGEDLDRLVGSLAERVRRTRPATMLHRGIRDAYERATERLWEFPGVESPVSMSGEPDPAKTQAAAALFVTDAETFLDNPELGREVFGPSTLIVRCPGIEELLELARSLEGQLTATLHATDDDLDRYDELRTILETRAGRLVLGGFPTGVEVCPSMHHGGPYPATTDVRSTSVGTAAITRFARPICYQDFPQSRLPPELHNQNVRGIWRQLEGVLTKDDAP